MSCKNMYFEICLTEMNYFAVRFLSRNLFSFSRLLAFSVTAGAGEKS